MRAKGATALEQALQGRLRQLPFPVLALLVRQLLLQSGYSRVHLQRTRWKGRNSGGGWDLSAFLEHGVAPRRVLVQVKQLTTPVAGRAVDELRGVLLRTGASHGLLITTGIFSPVARQAAENATVAEVTLMDGAQLATRLIEAGIGVTLSAAGDWQIDDVLFTRLAQSSRMQSSPVHGPAAAPIRPGASRPLLKITIALSRTRRRSGPNPGKDRVSGPNPGKDPDR